MDVLDQLDLSHIGANIQALTGPQELFGIAIVAIIALYGMSVGKTRAIISLLSIYIAFTLASAFPFVGFLERVPFIANTDAGIVRAGLFLVAYTGTFFIFHGTSLRSRLSMGEMKLAHVLLISVAQVGFLMSILLWFVPFTALPDHIAALHSYFGTPEAFFVWALLPLGIMPFVHGHK
ncbi:MAG: hypothetical protein QY311_00210 [Candidatus Paceibacterota bacterium]|nr:MAG: hypothetical protein QY311_00210 [Candidatus Paceibacterota bacterium]